MAIEFGISIGAALVGVLGLGISLNCLKGYRKNRNLLEFSAGQIEELENELAENTKLLEQSKVRGADQARRIAWLETRIRKPEKVKKDVLSEEVLVQTPVSNITERRHRVLNLAARGQDAETIAATLGLLRGEVELIINIGRGSNNYA